MENRDENSSNAGNGRPHQNGVAQPHLAQKAGGDGPRELPAAIVAARIGVAGMVLAAVITGIFTLISTNLQPKTPPINIDNTQNITNKSTLILPTNQNTVGPYLPRPSETELPAAGEMQKGSNESSVAAPSLQIRISGNIASMDAERLRNSVIDGLGDQLRTWGAVVIDIRCSARDAEQLIGDIPVAAISANWTINAPGQQAYDGAIRVIEAFGTSIAEARATAADSAGVVIAKRIITQLQLSRR